MSSSVEIVFCAIIGFIQGFIAYRVIFIFSAKLTTFVFEGKEKESPLLSNIINIFLWFYVATVAGVFSILYISILPASSMAERSLFYRAMGISTIIGIVAYLILPGVEKSLRKISKQKKS